MAVGKLISPITLQPDEATRKGAPFWRLILTGSSWFGTAFMMYLLFSLTTSYFEDTLGCGKVMSHIVWAGGPISGFLVQPIVGAVSDQCTSRLGRRRPFMIVGLIITILSALVFSNSKEISGGNNDIAVAIAFIMFYLMDFSINAVQGPSRALLSDMASLEQQRIAQSICCIMQGLGGFSATYVQNAFSSPIDSIQILFIIGVSVCAVVNVVAMLAAIDPQLRLGVRDTGSCDKVVDVEREGTSLSVRREAAGDRSVWALIKSAFVSIFVGIRTMKTSVMRVCAVQFFTWLALFCMIPWVTDWFKTDVLKADYNLDVVPSEITDKYVVHAANAQAFQQLVMTIAGLIIPFAIPFIGLKIAYSITLAPLAVILLLNYLIKPGHKDALIMYPITGISQAAVNIFPYTIIGLIFPTSEAKGLNMGLLNVWIVIPQLLDTAWTGIVASEYGDAFVMFIGGLSASIAVIGALFVVFPSPESSKAKAALEQELMDKATGDPVIEHLKEQELREEKK
eukprot:Nk52_evm5s2524 gene=Nk52_evmTU5s2524